MPSGRSVRSRTAPNLVYRPSSTAALQPRTEQLGSDLLAEIVNRVYATIGNEAYKAAVRTVTRDSQFRVRVFLLMAWRWQCLAVRLFCREAEADRVYLTEAEREALILCPAPVG